MKNVTYINAGAGSGKTWKLTHVLTDLIEKNEVQPEQVILTTFTTKAATEIKEEAKSALYERGLYEQASRLDQAMIGTVHSVCQRMIGKYWFNLGLSPNMGVMAEEDTSFYVSQSLSELPTEEELKQLHDFCRYFDIQHPNSWNTEIYGLNYDFWHEQLKRIIEITTNYELEDYTHSEEASIEFIRRFVKQGNNVEFSYNELKNVIQEHESFLRSCKQSKTNDGRIDSIVKAKRGIRNAGLGTLKAINDTIGTPQGYGQLATDFQERMKGIWTSQNVFEKQVEHIKLIFDLARRWRKHFAEFKKRKNLLDYNDMEKYMRHLMQNKQIASEIGKSYRYLFVDEFQDSSPIQVKIFDALSDLMEHSYWVGDYKQAIYGFRGTDVEMVKAVVGRISESRDGCSTTTLDTCYRSLPDIVDVNNAVFTKTFEKVLDRDKIFLNKKRENKENEKCLRYFISSKEATVANHVAKLLLQGAKQNEIAVLARTNAELEKVAQNLKEAHDIATSREEIPIVGTAACNLVESLLKIVSSDHDTLAKVQVAMLTIDELSAKDIIEERLLQFEEEGRDALFLAKVPLLADLNAIKPRLQQQSISAMVESLVIELNLNDIVKSVEGDAAFGVSCLQTIVKTAKTYEEHCVQMNLPTTIDGFIAYLEGVNPKGAGNPEGVQLHTYHSCKGLQWKYVILMSLNQNVRNEEDTVKKEVYGVHVVHPEKPIAKNLYPEILIRLTPWIYGNARKLPEEIQQKILASQDFKDAFEARISEANRLIYVGMTRPRDVLLLDVSPFNKRSGEERLKWFKDIGLSNVAGSNPSERWDCLGTGIMFEDFTLTEADSHSIFCNLKKEKDYSRDKRLKHPAPTFSILPPRYISPSGISMKGIVESHEEIGNRIPLGKSVPDMAEVGNCIHQVFAGIEDKRPSSKIDIDEIIRSYSLDGVLTDGGAIVTAWNNLVTYLTENFGKAIKTYHERPFRLERDGQMIVGSIDLVWQTEAGDILIDFKTCPMGQKYILDADSEHYAGWYAGQLDAYEDALEAAGEKVVKRYIYYPVSGILAEIGRGMPL